MLFQTVLKTSRHQSELGTFAQVSNQTHQLVKILCMGSMTFCSPEGQGGGSRMVCNPGITPAAHVYRRAVPQVEKTSVPRAPLPPRNNRVQGSTHSIKARAGPGQPKLPEQPEILRSPQSPPHTSVHRLALHCLVLSFFSSSPVSEGPCPCPSPFPLHTLRPRAELQTHLCALAQLCSVTKHCLGSIPALPTTATALIKL